MRKTSRWVLAGIFGLMAAGNLSGQGVQTSQKATVTTAEAKSVVRINGETLTAKGYVIAISSQAGPSEQYAALELQKHLEQMIGEKLTIVKDDQVGEHRFIAVGKSDLIKKVNVSIDWAKLGKEGIVVRVVGPNLILAGGVRGALYACYSFLEDDLGVRWYTPECTVLSKSDTIEIKDLNRTYVPPLEYREVAFNKALDADWTARNKCNGILYDVKKPVRLDTSHGGQVDFGGVHSFGWLFLPPTEYFKNHPEYYALVEGKRVSDGQVCLTNPDVENIVVNKILEMGRSNPSFNYVSVSQNDCYKNCQCPKCKAIDEKEGSPAGSMLNFVNRVAERVGKEFSDVTISTLAYQYTQKTPKFVKPRKNVAVVLCSIQSSFISPLSDDQNKAFRDDIKAWSKVSDRLYIWDYNVNYPFCLQPHPNFGVLKSNIKFFIKYGAKGVFEEGYHDDNYGEFHELRMWLLAKLLWNPNLNTNILIKDFLKGYYGPAASNLFKYITLMQTVAEKEKPYMDCFAPYKRFKFFSDANISEAAKCFDQAQESVRDNPIYLKRVEIARLPVLYMQILLTADAMAKATPTQRATLTDGYLQKLNQFEEYARLGGVTKRGMGGQDDGMPFEVDKWLKFMREKVQK
jgi:hypothetical protein